MDEREGRCAKLWRLRDAETFGGVLAGTSGVLALAGLDGMLCLVVGAAAAALVLLAVLMSRMFRAMQTAAVFWDAGVRGRGYIESFRRAEHSLLLMHVDDDAPGPELLGLYTELLGRGVLIRRILFRRPGHLAEGYEWMHAQPAHAGLRQKVIQAERGAMMLSFAVVDDSEVLLAVPGYRSAESAGIAGKAVLRHLIRLTDPSVTRAFLETYEAAWQVAEEMT